MQIRTIIGTAALLAAIALGAVGAFADDAPMATAPIPPPLPKGDGAKPGNTPPPPFAAQPGPSPSTSPSSQAADTTAAKSKQKALAAKKAAAKKAASRHHHNPAGQVAKEVAREAKEAERRDRASSSRPPRQAFAGGPPGDPRLYPPNAPPPGPGPYGGPWYGRGDYAYAPPYPGMRPPPW